METLAGRPVHVHTFDQWRAAARELLARQVAPDAVLWLSHRADGALFAAGAEPAPAAAVKPGSVRISRKLMELLQTAACCRVPNRWAFLYQVLWRWRHGANVLSARDADGARLHAMVRAVRREEHNMLERIRFRERRAEAGAPRFVAWDQPCHDVLAQVARRFAARMGRVTWMIATPDASALWDGARLHSTGALLRGPADVDAGAALWPDYYRSVFSPARLHDELVPGPAGDPGQAPATLNECRRCPLWQNATQAVPGAGPARARIMLVGEQPGDQEDLAGLPFVGPAGQLLERALSQAGLERRAVYLTNAVKHFKWEPRGKRRMHKTPAQREVEACSYWLNAELAQVRPKVVVALGSTALKAVTGNPHATLREAMPAPAMQQGRWIVAVYHPSYILRVPGDEQKEQAFQALVDGLRAAKRLGV